MEKAQILVSSTAPVPILVSAKYHISHTDFRSLITDLFKRGNQEQDTNFITVIVIDQALNEALENRLDRLSYHDKCLLLRYYFSHLNLIVVEKAKLDDATLQYIAQSVTLHDGQVNNRISRVQTWTLAGKTLDIGNLTNEIPVFNMISTLNNTINKTDIVTNRIKIFKDILVQEIDFKSLLCNHSTQHLSKLCNLVGHWSFPAHELTNDDLVYCVYLMLKYAMNQVDEIYDKIKLSDNELLALIFITRDTYKSGNPFHNFRHAVDVLQACFHFVIRLGYLPIFTQFQTNCKANEVTCLKLEKFGNAIELIALNNNQNHGVSKLPNLNKISTLALLVAALGHDVGHPGVTNQFMIKYSCPTSLLFNERSVLESFHSSVFLNKVLTINWPNLLATKVHSNHQITVKDIIISSILATDMGEHFEYIEKLTRFKKNSNNHQDQIKLISSLLIKCADISNVTRPLRVSSQWALVLSREFDEVSKLEEKLMDLDKEFEINYDKIPLDLDQILLKNPMMHKGQLFFINTFAQNLFDSITELLPELKYTGEIIKENKRYWEEREKEIG